MAETAYLSTKNNSISLSFIEFSSEWNYKKGMVYYSGKLRYLGAGMLDSRVYKK